MTPVYMADPASKVIKPFVSLDQINTGLQAGWIPVDANGNPMKVQQFEGGYLFDGAPLNVWLGLGWYAGQQAALQPYWQNGQIPVPPNAQLSQQTVAMPAAVAANTAAWLSSQEEILGLPWYLWAAGAAAWLLLR